MARSPRALYNTCPCEASSTVQGHAHELPFFEPPSSPAGPRAAAHRPVVPKAPRMPRPAACPGQGALGRPAPGRPGRLARGTRGAPAGGVPAAAHAAPGTPFLEMADSWLNLVAPHG